MASIGQRTTLSQGSNVTWVRGKEMADHKKFTIATDVQVYFCEQRSPRQRGSNENINGRTAFRLAHVTHGPQMSDQLLLEDTAGLHTQTAIVGFAG